MAALEITGEHRKRINLAILHIEAQLSDDLPLDEVAEVACFSSFHFHRLFKVITGETLNAFVRRRRIEKSASMLMRNPEVGIGEVGSALGFKSVSSFSRAFRQFYAVGPSAFRQLSPSKYSKISQVDRKNGQSSAIFEPYICDMKNQIKWLEANAKISVVDRPSMDLIRVNVIGLHRVSESFAQLQKWANPKGLLENEEVKAVIIYHDSLKVTAFDKARLSTCFSVKEKVEPSGEISLVTIQSGRQIVASMEIVMEEFALAWSGMFMWMNEQGYKRRDEDPFEIHHNNFREHPEQKCIVELCILVE